MGAGVQGGGDFQRVLTIRSPAVEVTFVKVSEQAESGSVEAMGRNEREGVCVCLCASKLFFLIIYPQPLTQRLFDQYGERCSQPRINTCHILIILRLISAAHAFYFMLSRLFGYFFVVN